MCGKIKALTLAVFLVIGMSLVSAISIDNVDTTTLSPGQTGEIRIEIENIFEDDATDFSIFLNFKELPFTPIGASEQSVDKIEEDDDELFVFRFRASSDSVPGDYEIPYTMNYEINGNERTRTGTFGVRITASPELVFTISTETPVQDSRGSISLKIVNKGFSDARFVSVKVLPDGFTLLSDDEVYIGAIDSDDFETANFDVIFSDLNPDFLAIIKYRDFDNKELIKNVELPMKVYTKQRATELGIIQKSNTLLYTIGAAVLIILWLVWRAIRKRRRLKKSRRLEEK